MTGRCLLELYTRRGSNRVLFCIETPQRCVHDSCQIRHSDPVSPRELASGLSHIELKQIKRRIARAWNIRSAIGNLL